MGGKPKRRKLPGVMRTILAHNITRRMHVVFATEPNKDKALAEAAGVSLSTVQRIRGADVGASIDQIEEIAKALRSSVAELLTPREDIRRFLLAAEPEADYRPSDPPGRIKKQVESDPLPAPRRRPR